MQITRPVERIEHLFAHLCSFGQDRLDRVVSGFCKSLGVLNGGKARDML